MHGLSEDDLEIQAKVRGFIDEVIPYEVEAEMSEGQFPDAVGEKFDARARELGLLATNMPVELGGGGYTTLQQVLVQEQVGRATNAGGRHGIPAATLAAADCSR
jgi:acyl-CoA dehydrogenase